MPKPYQRTRSNKRRVLNLVSGSGQTTHYKRARAKAARCINCGRTLLGVPNKTLSELNRLSKSQKRPQRMFGGQLCHACLKESLKQAVRSAAQA
jgi:large subunit ribosomal protein L34e